MENIHLVDQEQHKKTTIRRVLWEYISRVELRGEKIWHSTLMSKNLDIGDGEFSVSTVNIDLRVTAFVSTGLTEHHVQWRHCY